MTKLTESFLCGDGFIVMLFAYACGATVIGHPFVGLALGFVAFTLFLAVYIGERRNP